MSLPGGGSSSVSGWASSYTTGVFDTINFVLGKSVRWVTGKAQNSLSSPSSKPSLPPPSDDDLVFEAWATCRRDPGKRGKMPPQPWRGAPFSEMDCGEDSFLVSENVLGIADGVGSWRRMGINSGLFSNQLLQNVKHFADAFGESDPLRLMQKAYEKLIKNKEVTGGSSTACLASVARDGTLTVANLGDSGLMVIREGQCHFHMEECSYQFNTPYQLAAPISRRDQISNKPADSKVKSIPVQEGDMVVLGSDGLFDNLFPDEIAKIVSFATPARQKSNPFLALFNPILSVKNAAELLEKQTYSASTDRSRLTPFATEASAAGVPYMGGKMDDITVILAKVQRRKNIARQ